MRQPPFTSVLSFLCGGTAFVVITVFLTVGRCTTNEFMIDCGGHSGSATGLVVGIAAVLGIAAVMSRLGRNFASGFIVAFIGIGILTAGGCTKPWFDPYYTYLQKTAPARMKREAQAKRDATQRAWIEAMNGRRMDVARGVELAASVMECAQILRRDQGGFPQTEANLAIASCPDARIFRASTPPDGGRYELPSGGTAGDAGWRYTYTSLESGFAVDAAPDSRLDHKWPQLRATSDGNIQVTMNATTPPISLSPVTDLRRLAQCLQAIPAEEERRHTNRILGRWFLTDVAKRLCSDLTNRLQAPRPNNDTETQLLLVIPGRDGSRPATAVTYTVRIDPRPSNQPFGFDLYARATIAGLPRYLATSEGTVHSTVEFRKPTPSDPAVIR